ncbi:Vitamin K-dependent gamma-carboxylase [Thalassococcus halodurans]|uniref:Vitamin K-dependent gamma-carboxylase n=1 Tax=Thalassococcus halodurans TaxID=373675 RepID=A0A1H5X3Y8_9RHOB|nr:HTTM domain-containing protein [Thalassococcus halodurans]SEG06273.1 Vitamin K-dependent gamma-carboxylase [Thalassococcus halodurans]
MSEALQSNAKPSGFFDVRVRPLISIDFRSLAAFRILASLTMLYVCAVLYPDLITFYSNSGLLSTELLSAYYPHHRFSLLTIFHSDVFIYVVWFGLVASSCSLLLGYRSRTSAAICFILYLSFAGRNPVLNQGGDVLHPLLLFWAIFLPTGRVFGIDGALEKDRNTFEAPSILSIATVGLLMQVLYVYVFGALLKTGSYWVPNGQAILIAMHLDTFATDASHFARQFPIILGLLTFFVFYLELFAPLILFFPDKKQRVRAVGLALIVIMHFGFRTFLSIGHFWLSSLSSLMTYIPTRIWDSVCEKYWKAEQRKIRLYYDRDCGFCLKTCLLLREFFLPHNVFIGPAQDDPVIGEILVREDSWVVVTPDGEHKLRWDALVYVTNQSILMRPFWLIAYLIKKIGIGALAYNAIGKNRRGFSKFTAFFLPFRKARLKNNILVNTGLCIVIALCFLWNLDQNKPRAERSDAWGVIKPAMSRTGFTQRWNMFAPHPAFTDGYPIIRLSGDLGQNQYYTLSGAFSETWEHPERLQAYFPSYRWRKYFNRIAKFGAERRELMFGRYANILCGSLLEDPSALPFLPVSISIDWA